MRASALRSAGRARGEARRVVQDAGVPATQAREDHNAAERQRGEPGEPALAARQDDKGDEQGPDRGADISADLEDRLRQAVCAAGGEAREARRFRVEDRRSHAEQRRPGDHGEIVWRERKGDERRRRDAHADRQGIGRGMTVGIKTDDRLKDGSGKLIGEGEEADLPETQIEDGPKDRIARREQRLGRVVEEMANARREQDRQRESDRAWREMATGVMTAASPFSRRLPALPGATGVFTRLWANGPQPGSGRLLTRLGHARAARREVLRRSRPAGCRAQRSTIRTVIPSVRTDTAAINCSTVRPGSSWSARRTAPG